MKTYLATFKEVVEALEVAETLIPLLARGDTVKAVAEARVRRATASFMVLRTFQSCKVFSRVKEKREMMCGKVRFDGCACVREGETMMRGAHAYVSVSVCLHQWNGQRQTARVGNS